MSNNPLPPGRILLRKMCLISLCPRVGAEDPIEEDMSTIRLHPRPYPGKSRYQVPSSDTSTCNIKYAEATTTEAAAFYVHPINSVQEAADVIPEADTF